MDLSLIVSIPVPLLGILGAALVAAGVVAYRGSASVWVRAFGAAAVAAGGTVWALLLFITPVSVTSSPAPTVISSTGSAAPIEMSSASSATQTNSPTAVPTTGQQTDWKLYRDESHGIEFRYPAACSVAPLDGSINVGGRIELVVADARGLALQDYVSQFVEERTRTSGWKLDSQQTVTLGENNGERVDYRFGGTNRFGTAVFIAGKGQVYIWGLTAGGFTCDEPAAFDGIVSSFRFPPAGPPTPTVR